MPFAIEGPRGSSSSADPWEDRSPSPLPNEPRRTPSLICPDLRTSARYRSRTTHDQSITMPALFAYSNTDRSDLNQVRQNLKRKPSKNKIFLSYPGGHGYELLQDQNTGELSPLASRVQRFVANGS